MHFKFVSYKKSLYDLRPSIITAAEAAFSGQGCRQCPLVVIGDMVFVIKSHDLLNCF